VFTFIFLRIIVLPFPKVNKVVCDIKDVRILISWPSCYGQHRRTSRSITGHASVMDIIPLQTVCWEIGDESRSWNKIISCIENTYSTTCQLIFRIKFTSPFDKNEVILPCRLCHDFVANFIKQHSITIVWLTVCNYYLRQGWGYAIDALFVCY